MRRIVKRGREPDTLLQHRKSHPEQLNWAALLKAERDSIRTALLEDQRRLCCYCLRRIDLHDMKVEHYRSQSRYPDDELAWKNLLAACSGNEGGPRHQQTCDTRKGDDDLSVHPLDEATLRGLRYLADGRIRSDLPDVDADLNERLNLNFSQLCRNRMAAFDAFKSVLSKKYGALANWSKSHLETELHRLEQKNPYPPFVSVLETWLKKLIQRK